VLDGLLMVKDINDRRFHPILGLMAGVATQTKSQMPPDIANHLVKALIARLETAKEPKVQKWLTGAIGELFSAPDDESRLAFLDSLWQRTVGYEFSQSVPPANVAFWNADRLLRRLS